jgi:hypothetical protein
MRFTTIAATALAALAVSVRYLSISCLGDEGWACPARGRRGGGGKNLLLCAARHVRLAALASQQARPAFPPGAAACAPLRADSPAYLRIGGGGGGGRGGGCVCRRGGGRRVWAESRWGSLRRRGRGGGLSPPLFSSTRARARSSLSARPVRARLGLLDVAFIVCSIGWIGGPLSGRHGARAPRAVGHGKRMPTRPPTPGQPPAPAGAVPGLRAPPDPE